MAKFSDGSWVKPKDQSAKGIVRGYKGGKTLVRWIGAKKATPYRTADLKVTTPPTALVLEGSLDGDLTSVRSEEDLLRNFFRALGGQIAYKTIHCPNDLAIIGSAIKTPPPFIHISCHGAHEGDRPFLLFAPKATAKNRIFLDDPEVVSTFKEWFEGYPILFSACLIGKLEKPIIEFLQATQIAQAAAFTREVWDTETMLFELLVYHGMLVEGHHFAAAVQKAADAVRLVGIKGGHGQQFVKVFEKA